MNIVITCTNCGTPYPTWEAWAKKRKKHFCSKQCRKEHDAFLSPKALSKKEYHRRYYLAHKDKKSEQAKKRSDAQKEAKKAYDALRRQLCGNDIRKNDRLKAYAERGEPKAILERAKRRAKAAGLPFDLTLEDILVPESCPVLGIPLFSKEGRGGGDNSPSIDRLAPEKGYIRGNVAIISNRANRIKTNATHEEILKVAGWIKQMETLRLPEAAPT